MRLGTTITSSHSVASRGRPLRENTLTAQQKCTAIAGYSLIEVGGGPRARGDLGYALRTGTGVSRCLAPGLTQDASRGRTARHPQEMAAMAFRWLAISRAFAPSTAGATRQRMEQRRNIRALWRGAGAGSAMGSVRATVVDPGSTTLVVPVAGGVSTGPAQDSGIETASAGLQIANVSGQDTPRASLTAISSAVSRHVGYRPAIGRASSLLMICFASLLRPTADSSTARLLK
jgi:hypothetical protein